MPPEEHRVDRLAVVAAATVFFVLALAVAYGWQATHRQVSDLTLYEHYGERLLDGSSPYADLEVEYPPGALPVFVVPAALGSGATSYRAWFGICLGLIGATGIVLVAAARARLRASRRETELVLAALALSPLVLGEVLLDRFDLFPAALTAAVLLALLADRHRLAAVLLGVAIVVKLYPLVLLPLAVAWAWRRRGRREGIVVAALATGVTALTYLPFAITQPIPLAESIGNQVGRPLQIESLGSGLLLVLHQIGGLDIEWASSSGSQNLVGSLPNAVAVVISTLQVVTLAWLWIRFARGEPTAERLVLHSAATVVAFVALGKVLSPQFLVWPLFLVALATGRRLAAAGVAYLAAAALTLVWFPAWYWALVKEFDPVGSWAVLFRDFALIALLGALALPIRERARGRAPARSPLPAPSPRRT